MTEQQMIPIAFFVTLAIGLIIAAGIALFALHTLKRLYLRLKQREMELATTTQSCDTMKIQLEAFEELRKEHMKLVEERASAVTERAEAMRQIDTMLEERNLAREERDHAKEQAAEADKLLELNEQRMRDLQRRMEDWEQHRKEFIKLSEAAVLEAGSKMSSKLLEDHKRESEEVKRQQEMQVKETTEKLLVQFEATHNFASLDFLF